MCSGMVGSAFGHLGDPQAPLPSFGLWYGQREGFVPLHPGYSCGHGGTLVEAQLDQQQD